MTSASFGACQMGFYLAFSSTPTTIVETSAGTRIIFPQDISPKPDPIPSAEWITEARNTIFLSNNIEGITELVISYLTG